MAPFTAWLPAQRAQAFDLLVHVAGGDMAGLTAGSAALEAALTAEGFDVMAQRGLIGGPDSLPTMRLRVSTEPVTSMGHGCDVLAYLEEDVPAFHSLSLARGSVVLGEARAIPKLLPDATPIGVIAYSVPFAELSRRVGKSTSGKGLVAAGALSRLLGMSPELVRGHIGGGPRRRYFDAGVTYAGEHLVKRDVFALPQPRVARRHVMLDAHRAVLLGLGMSMCRCEPSCSTGMDRSPDHWVTAHVKDARQAVSLLRNQDMPGVTVYHGLGGRLMTLVGSDDPTVLPLQETDRSPCILMASDLPGAVRLAGVAHQVVPELDRAVWVLVDGMLAGRAQSVSVQTLEQIAQNMQQRRHPRPAASDSFWPLSAECDGEPGAAVGYVAWGAAQGVVREAVVLCRSFGMSVAAFYPNVLNPFPVDELEAFAASVQHLVVVEPTQAGRYTNLVTAATRLRPSTIRPEPDEPLTPMNLFMREGLGA